MTRTDTSTAMVELVAHTRAAAPPSSYDHWCAEPDCLVRISLDYTRCHDCSEKVIAQLRTRVEVLERVAMAAATFGRYIEHLPSSSALHSLYRETRAALALAEPAPARREEES